MVKLYLFPLSAILLLAQDSSKPFAGRWDFHVTATDGRNYPQWMEVVDKAGGPQIRIQPRGGAVRPAVAAAVEGSHLLITVSAASSNQPEVKWDLTAAGDKLNGVQKTAGKESAKLEAVRAPELKRAAPKAWTKPEPLFNGKDLTGWEPIGDPSKSHWVAKGGELVNEDKGANIRTTQKFDDFKLHIEFNCPDHCNSGIYLRGRYEIQVGTEGGSLPSHEMGAVYGYFPAAVEMPMKVGEWQTFDITLVGRTVTVVRNGTKIHDRVELPGITGGALDSNEAEPGPFFLQGDHTGGLKYRNITVAVPRK
ncbi:MAG: DUF1080 domain-containing protein [Bryobacteraceae bacterium]